MVKEEAKEEGRDEAEEWIEVGGNQGGVWYEEAGRRKSRRPLEGGLGAPKGGPGAPKGSSGGGQGGCQGRPSGHPRGPTYLFRRCFQSE